MNLVMRQGAVTQVSPVLKVAIGASTIGTECKKDASYAPAIGDQVKVLDQDGDRFVLGKIG